MDNSSDMDGVESENCSLSSSLPAKMENGSIDFNPSISSAPTLQQTTINPLKQDDFSSCEDETDESYSDTESEMREESLEKDASLSSSNINNNTIKRFSGDCETVTDVLTEHDRTKNRKTYHVTKMSNGNGNANGNTTGVIEKLEMSLTSVSEGIHIRLEESTPAEDYFGGSGSTTGSNIIESFISELIDQAAEHCDKSPVDDDNFENLDDEDFENERMENQRLTRGQKLRGSDQRRRDISSSHFKKRLSNTSKASSDSSTSNMSRDNNSCQAAGSYDSDRDAEERGNRDSQKSDRDNDSEGERRSIPSGGQENLDWSKAQESLENSKKNVEILRQNAAMDGSSRYFKRKISVDNKRPSERLHPFHTHMLLYYGVYDTEQVLYSFQTLRNIIACDCRTFLCLSTTTSISNSPIKQQLVR